MKKLTALFPAILFALACGAPDETGQQTESIISGVVASAFPTACLVDVYADVNYKTRTNACSGVVIAPALVLTAGHCIVEGKAFHVICPFLNQDARGLGQAHPNFYLASGGALAAGADDLGVVYLTTRILAASYPVLPTQPVATGTKAVNIGRTLNGVDSFTTLYQGSPVAVAPGSTLPARLGVTDAAGMAAFDFARDYVASDAIEPGDSGGPAYQSGAAVPTLLGINSGASQKPSYELMARVDLNHAWIVKQVESWGGFSVPPGYQPLEPHAPSPYPH